MPDGLNVAYSTDGLFTGASGLRTAQGDVEIATARLSGARLAVGLFGATPGAGGFAAAVGAAREAQVRGFRQESGRSGSMSGRSRTVGNTGDGLTAATTAIAAANQPPPAP
jgi:hypothetical protein